MFTKCTVHSPAKELLIGRIQIIVAMVTFGTIGAFVKNNPLPPAEFALYRGIIAFLVLTIFIFVSGKTGIIVKERRYLWRFFLSGAIIAVNWVLLFSAYQHTTIALATLSYYFAPTMVIGASILLLRESITLKQIICFLISTSGLVLTIGVTGGGTDDISGIFFGIGAAVLYAAVILINKSTKQVDSMVRTWVQFAAVIIVLTPYVIMTDGFHSDSVAIKDWFSILFVGIVHTGLMYYIYFSSLTRLSGQQAAILSYIDPVVALFVSFFLLGESISILQLFGGLLILGATFVNELRIKPLKRQLN
ncbi:MAG: DMT family transporter [Sphaerochaetaceae bacterium]|nr:DMT family transporter [Sphaerochaetaceae bacterium]